MSRETEDILNERESQYGSFADNARLAQKIKSAYRAAAGYETMTFVQCESIDMIAAKLARLINGDHTHRDSWDDIKGYVQLVIDEIDGTRRAEKQ